MPKDTANPLRIGVDVGGTFTDLVVVSADGVSWVFKVPSVPSDPSAGVMHALREAAGGMGMGDAELLRRCSAFVHGSTIATNTVLERKGACVGLLATRGFRDSIAIRRGLRENPWDIRTPFAKPLVPRHLRLGIGGRMDRDGTELEPVSREDIEKALATFRDNDVEAIAVCLLNSYVNGAHEQEVFEILRELDCDLPISCSSVLAPVMGEYERGSTTVIDAYIRQRVVQYLQKLNDDLRQLGLQHDILIIQSNGGAASLERVSRAPVAICLSGPAAGVGAMNFFGKRCDATDLLTMEIGGTSCDVTMVRENRAQLTDLYRLGGFHVAQPAVEIHTVGAGGGTIARIDEGGLLACGPDGAGADPGPACYGRGGFEPTTTDALVVMGRMRVGPLGDGSIEIDADLARKAIEERIARPLALSNEEAAAGIVRLLEQNLLHAVEEISVKRGIDPAGFTLIAAGGAGPMHGAAIARELGCRRVYVPRHAGAFCALGMLESDLRIDVMRVFDADFNDVGLASAAKIAEELNAEAKREVEREGLAAESGAFQTELDLTYKGQLKALRIPWNCSGESLGQVKDRFEAEHRRAYGHIKPITPIRIVGARQIVTIPAIHLAASEMEPSDGPASPSSTRRVFVNPDAGWEEVPVYEGPHLLAGQSLDGPLIIEEQTMTLFAEHGDRVRVDSFGNYLIELDPDS